MMVGCILGDVGSLCVCGFVVLESLLFRGWAGGEVGWGRVVCFGYDFPEVRYMLSIQVYSDDWLAASVRFL